VSVLKILKRNRSLIAISDDLGSLVAEKDAWLLPEELEKLGQLRNRTRWEQSVAARVLLKLLMRRKLGKRALGLKLYRKTSGGLGLRGFKTRCFLSVSHSEGWIAAAISDQAIGVDIQKRRSLKNETALRRRISNTNDHVSNRLATLDLWALKEAVMKAHGRGLIPQASLIQQEGLQFVGQLGRARFDAGSIRVSRDVALAWAERL